MTRHGYLGMIAGLMLLALPTPQVVAQQEVYTWTDQNGVVNFSNSGPPEGAQAKAIHFGGEFRPVPLEADSNSADRKLVRVELQGTQQHAEVRMIVDTGAQKTMIDAALANQIGVHWMGDQLVGGVTGVGVGSLVEVPRLRIGSAELRDVDVVVGPVPGFSLLGMDVLNRLDLSVGQNTLFRSNR
ncbi:MAG TPA: retroviral-like aspartic protease family protein [Candidatus Binatia bacterium]